MTGGHTPDLWIFGYGSLVWRPAFVHAQRRPGWIEGWSRRFWQWSTDHRGIPTAPGRVATVIRTPGARCHGMTYRLQRDHAEAVLEQLDVREQGGYDRVEVDVHFRDRPDGPAPRALMYVATERNPNYAGPTPLAEIAAIVRARRGPSGPNDEYLLRLAEALRDMQADDPHVFALERLLHAG